MSSNTSFDPAQLKIFKNFRIKKKRGFFNRFKDKDILLAYEVSEDKIEDWKFGGFKKANSLLKFLENRYIGLNNFNLILFNEKNESEYFEVKENGVTNFYINYPKFAGYCNSIEKFLKNLRIVKFNNELYSIFSGKIIEGFFDRIPTSILEKHIDATHFKIIEGILAEFDSLPEEEKTRLMEKIEYSSSGTRIIEKYRELKPESPEIQLKLFMKVIDKLGPEGFSELARSVLSGDRLVKLVKEIGSLPLEDQAFLMKDIPSAARLISLYEALKESLKRFESLIKKHKKSEKKNEASVHSFLSENYWLLGIEYFDRVIKTSINEFGKKINETAFYKFTVVPDFTIEMINGNIDECVVIEIEAPNDMIFKKDGNLSKMVFDGIHQAMIYTVLKKVEGKEAHGIAVIGYSGKTDKEKIKQIRILRNNYPFIKILTYDDIINNAQTVIKFLEKYKNKSSQ